MYKMSLYSVYDKAAKTYNSPICCITDDVAIRLLRETLRDPSTIISRYPQDYELIKVGDFMVENGLVVPCHDVLVSDFRKLLDPEPGAAVGAEPPQAAERPEASSSRCPGCDQQLPAADPQLPPHSKAEKK